MKGFLVNLVLLILLSGIPAFADNDKGWEALESGDYATALKEWKPLAEQGDAEAQNNLGSLYQNGLGVTQDYKVAVQWYKLAANQGNTIAQYNLGTNYDQGTGVAQSYTAAFKWYQLAAEQGSAKAQYSLGWAYGKGQGVREDILRAYMWWEIAASTGLKEAIESRDNFEEVLPPTLVKKAKEMARECEEKDYKDC